jgi:nicotinamidase-related amidase
LNLIRVIPAKGGAGKRVARRQTQSRDTVPWPSSYVDHEVAATARTGSGLMPRIQADSSGLVVIDAQPGFYRDRADVDEHDFAAFVERASWLVGVAVALRIPTVVTVENPERNGHTADEITKVLAADVSVFDKATFDLTCDDAIRSAVQATGRRTAVLVGMETDVCVAQSAIGLADLGLRVAAVLDATYSPGSAHQHGLERMRGAGIELVSAKGLFYEWLPSLDALRKFKRANPELARPAGIQL